MVNWETECPKIKVNQPAFKPSRHPYNKSKNIHVLHFFSHNFLYFFNQLSYHCVFYQILSFSITSRFIFKRPNWELNSDKLRQARIRLYIVAAQCSFCKSLQLLAFHRYVLYTLIACFYALQILESQWVVFVLHPPPEEKHIPLRTTTTHCVSLNILLFDSDENHSKITRDQLKHLPWKCADTKKNFMLP